MKSTIKRIIAIVILACLVVCTTYSVYASEPQYNSATVKYTVDDYYMVMIPETINVGTTSTITASEINIADGKTIRVVVDGLDINGAIQLYNDNNNDKTIDVYFSTENGDQIFSADNEIGRFQNSTDGMPQSIRFNTSTNANPQEVPAGTYTGTVYFSIYCE